ncbi:MAG: efflux RND transporter periplasmic adaptor subunit, partial [Gemmatimonadales bacterium]
CSSGNGEQRNQRPPTAVAVVAAERQNLARTVTLTGPVEPIRVIGVNSQASGTILAVRVTEGDRVRPGQVLAELDARETTAQLERARAIRANARTAFERSEEMQKARIITDAEFEQARAAYATATSDVQLWETRLEFARVTAPSAGVITNKAVETGSAVSTNQRLFDIADDALLVVRVQMSELDVVHVADNDSVSVRLDAQPGVRLRGWVRRIFPSADPNTRLVPVEVGLARPPPTVRIQPGFLARADFNVERRTGVLAVPAGAIGAASDGNFVFVVANDTLSRRPVVTGMTSAGFIEVVDGLAPGELVVTSGQVNLRAGTEVRVTAGRPIPDSASVVRMETP